MASQQINTSILRNPNDWENWYRDLRSSIWPEIWEILDLKGPEKSTLNKPERPLFTEYYAGATRYSDLNQTKQKSFINVCYAYKTDLKEYI